MDPLLRSELIRYGELAQACYDAFDYDLASRYCGSCKYPRRAFFERLGMPDAARGYSVTRYLYATSNFRFPNFFSGRSRADAKLWSQRANWIGYVAVSTDEESARLGRRDIAIAWRGTITRLEWVSDLMDYLRPVADEGIPCPDPEVKVESGFVDLYTDKDPSCRFCKYSAREQVLVEVRKLVAHHTALGEDVSISVTGHSLGSSLAILSAYDIAESAANLSNGKVPWQRGAVRAGERARPGAGEQGVRLPQGPPLRATLLAPGREQGHGPRLRRPLDPARPPWPPPRRPPPRRSPRRRRRPPRPLPPLPPAVEACAPANSRTQPQMSLITVIYKRQPYGTGARRRCVAT
ncbi:hypothetical protein VPH35_003009 [Triticum aestivum]